MLTSVRRMSPTLKLLLLFAPSFVRHLTEMFPAFAMGLPPAQLHVSPLRDSGVGSTSK
jgi:hypothetical protein